MPTKRELDDTKLQFVIDNDDYRKYQATADELGIGIEVVAREGEKYICMSGASATLSKGKILIELDRRKHRSFQKFWDRFHER